MEKPLTIIVAWLKPLIIPSSSEYFMVISWWSSGWSDHPLHCWRPVCKVEERRQVVKTLWTFDLQLLPFILQQNLIGTQVLLWGGRPGGKLDARTAGRGELRPIKIFEQWGWKQFWIISLKKIKLSTRWFFAPVLVSKNTFHYFRWESLRWRAFCATTVESAKCSLLLSRLHQGWTRWPWQQ